MCIEKDRIYPKYIFYGKKVGLFPFNDRAPCPIKLILDFCVDICLYLASNPKGVAAIHCKAGKGRTGVMIVCYLIFSCLCKNSDEALIHYAKQRTINNKGVTIPSQIRYIKYFESFLCANYEKPYIKCIPKMIKYDLNKGYKNMIINYNTDLSYFTTINSFRLKSCVIGPFQSDLHLNFEFVTITKNKVNLEDTYIYKSIKSEGYFYEIHFNKNNVINFDLNLIIRGKNIYFYSWLNFWYATYEIISEYINENKYFQDLDDKQKENKSEISTDSSLKEDELMSAIENLEKGPRKRTVNISFNLMKKKHKSSLKKVNATDVLKNNKDLNNILAFIDDLANAKKVPLIDRNNLIFSVKRQELDKLKTKCKDEFEVKYKFQLL